MRGEHVPRAMETLLSVALLAATALSSYMFIFTRAERGSVLNWVEAGLLLMAALLVGFSLAGIRYGTRVSVPAAAAALFCPWAWFATLLVAGY